MGRTTPVPSLKKGGEPYPSAARTGKQGLNGMVLTWDRVEALYVLSGWYKTRVIARKGAGFTGWPDEAISTVSPPKRKHRALSSGESGLRTGPHAYRRMAGIGRRLLPRPAHFTTLLLADALLIPPAKHILKSYPADVERYMDDGATGTFPVSGADGYGSPPFCKEGPGVVLAQPTRAPTKRNGFTTSYTSPFTTQKPGASPRAFTNSSTARFLLLTPRSSPLVRF